MVLSSFDILRSSAPSSFASARSSCADRAGAAAVSDPEPAPAPSTPPALPAPPAPPPRSMFPLWRCSAAAWVARASRYCWIPPGRFVRLPSPNSAQVVSQIRSTRYRSCEMTTMVPTQPSSRLSSSCRVSMSRSLVGSSSSRTFGSAISTRVSCSRRRSPPERSPTGVRCRFGENPRRSASWEAVSSLSPICTRVATSSTASINRRCGSRSSSS